MLFRFYAQQLKLFIHCLNKVFKNEIKKTAIEDKCKVGQLFLILLFFFFIRSSTIVLLTTTKFNHFQLKNEDERKANMKIVAIDDEFMKELFSLVFIIVR